MAEDQGQLKPRGRPPKNASRPKNGSFTFRLRSDMREQLEATAKARNLSLSEEIERKIAFANNVAEDPETEAVVMALVTAIKFVKASFGKSWKEDKNAALMTIGAIGAASSIVLTPYIGSDLSDEISKKASRAGEAIGHKALGIMFKLPDEAVIDLGREEMMDFRLSASGVADADLSLVKALIKRNSAQPAYATPHDPRQTEEPTPAPNRRKASSRDKVDQT